VSARRPRRGSLPPSGTVTRGGQGLSAAQVSARHAAQLGRCMVCGRETPLHEMQRDHDHALAVTHGHPHDVGCARCFRALLCRPCNSMLGFASDDPTRLRAGADYVEAFRARTAAVAARRAP